MTSTLEQLPGLFCVDNFFAGDPQIHRGETDFLQPHGVKGNAHGGSLSSLSSAMDHCEFDPETEETGCNAPMTATSRIRAASPTPVLASRGQVLGFINSTAPSWHAGSVGWLAASILGRGWIRGSEPHACITRLRS